MEQMTTAGASMQFKAGLSATGTAGGSALSFWLSHANAWATEYMPLISATGILVGAVMTIWYYTSLVKLKKRELEKDG